MSLQAGKPSQEPRHENLVQTTTASNAPKQRSTAADAESDAAIELDLRPPTFCATRLLWRPHQMRRHNNHVSTTTSPRHVASACGMPSRLRHATYAAGDGCASPACSANFRLGQFRKGQHRMAKVLLSGKRHLTAWPPSLVAREVWAAPHAQSRSEARRVLSSM